MISGKTPESTPSVAAAQSCVEHEQANKEMQRHGYVAGLGIPVGDGQARVESGIASMIASPRLGAMQVSEEVPR
jgi:hypothetical protein